MRKQLTGLVVLATATVLLAAWSKPIKSMITPEKTTDKNISFAVYKTDEYSSAVYDDASAKLQVTVTKVRGNERTVVWQKNYDAMLLKQYPTLQNALNQNVLIPGVVDGKDHLEVSYTLTYDSKGSVMQLQDSREISSGAVTGRLFINI
jgi:hypothetical protein